MIRCPSCGGIVDERALSCKYCGHRMNYRQSGSYDWNARTKRATCEGTNRTQRRQSKYVPKRAEKPAIDTDYMAVIIAILLMGILILQIVEILIILIK